MARRIIILVAAAFIILNVVIVITVVFSGKAPPPVPLPNPNGYDDFVAGASKVNGNVFGYAAMDHDQLATLVSNNTEALKLLSAGLSKECRVPVVDSTNYLTDLSQQVGSFKNCGLLLAATGRLAELENRTNDAIQCYLDGIRFGQENFRGGLAMSRLIGVACETLAAKRLDSLITGLDAKQCRTAATALESIDAREEPPAETMKQEKYWGRKTGGFRDRIAGFFLSKMGHKARDAISAKWDANTLRRRQLMLDAAARAYELDKGRRPQNAGELVTAYLKTAPKDPVSGTDLRVSQ